MSKSNSERANRWEYVRSRIILHLQILEREAILNAASVQKIRDVLDEVNVESRPLPIEKIIRPNLQTGRTLKAK